MASGAFGRLCLKRWPINSGTNCPTPFSRPSCPATAMDPLISVRCRLGLGRLDAVVLGPGIGQHPSEDRIWEQLQTFPGLLVLDADGLNRLAQLPAVPWLQGRRGPPADPPQRRIPAALPDLSNRPPLGLQRNRRAERLRGATQGARSVSADPAARAGSSAAPARCRAGGTRGCLAGFAGGLGALALAVDSPPMPPCWPWPSSPMPQQGKKPAISTAQGGHTKPHCRNVGRNGEKTQSRVINRI